MLDITDLRAGYGAGDVLDGLSLSVAEGETVALLGRNGAGKSTTLKAIMGLLDRVSGHASYRGTALVGLATHRIARLGIGYVPEDRRVFGGLTVLDNLAVGRRETDDTAPEWSLDALFALFPNLAERRHALGRHLSGGEQQMLAIARTLMGNPRLVLLDEPSEGIAPVIVEQMGAAIASMRAHGLTVLLSEQNLRFARAVADRACILERGRIRFDGRFSDLDADPSIAQKYLAL